MPKVSITIALPVPPLRQQLIETIVEKLPRGVSAFVDEQSIRGAWDGVRGCFFDYNFQTWIEVQS